ncbi:DNA polymerase phi-domain-containing protein [Lipomyces kononenkoae]|uniref:DNA polymerase phi-domain-containing protein n=1 Tax=Lipomyces kononenkoae TaxID=34357 RepID=A0ACC3TCG1_LIPKO
MSSKDDKFLDELYRRLGDSDATVRELAADEILTGLIKENNLLKWNQAIERLLAGVGSPQRTLRLGHSHLLGTVLYTIRGEVSTKQFCKMLEVDKISSKEPNGSDRKVPALQVLLAVHTYLSHKELVSNPKLASTDINSLFEILFKVAERAVFVRELAFAILCNALVNLPDRLVDPDLQYYILRRLADDRKTYITLDGVAVYLSIRSRTNFDTSLGQKKKNKYIHWNYANPLARSNFDVLSRIINGAPLSVSSPSIEQLTGTDHGDFSYLQAHSWRKRRHCLWDAIAALYARPNTHNPPAVGTEEYKADTVPFQMIWAKVDSKYFVTELDYVNSDKSMAGCNILSTFVKTVDIDYFNQLFTRNVSRELTFSSNDRLNDRLHSMVTKRVADALKLRCQEHPLDVPVIWKLLLCHVPTFDKNSSSYLSSIVSEYQVDDSLIDGTYNMLEDLYLRPTGQVIENSARSIGDLRREIIGIVFQLLKSTRQRIFVSSTWRKSAIRLLVWTSCFKTIDPTSELYAAPELTQPQVILAKQRLESAMTFMISENTQKLVEDGGNKQTISWPYLSVQVIQELEADSDRYTLVNPVDQKLIGKARRILKSLQALKSGESTDPKVNLIEMFVSLIVLLVYTGTAVDEELEDVIKFGNTITNDILKQHRRKRKNQDKTTGPNKKRKVSASDSVTPSLLEFAKDDDVIEGEIGTILVEMILVFSTKKSTVLKEACENLMKSFANLIDEEALRLFYNVLQAKENLNGQNELFDVEDDEVDMDEEDEDEDEDEDDEPDSVSSDDENASDGADNNSDDDDDGGGGGGSDGVSIDDTEDGTAQATDQNKIFEAALGKVLGVGDVSSKGKTSNSATGHTDSDSESEEDMTDEQMLALDHHIAALFKDRVSGSDNKQTIASRKKLEKQAKENVVFAKTRTLDMLNAFIRSFTGNAATGKPTVSVEVGHLILSMIMPLLKLIKTTTNDGLRSRTYTFVRTELSRIQFQISPADDIYELLTSVLNDTAHTNGSTYTNACAAVAMFLCKLLYKSDTGQEESPEVMQKLMTIYTNFMQKWASDKKLATSSNLFIEFIRWVEEERKK